MAINKKYELVPKDPDTKIYLSLQDFRRSPDDGGSHIQVTLHDDEVGNEQFEETTIWLTTEEAHELRAVLSVILGCATNEDVVVAEGPHVIS